MKKSPGSIKTQSGRKFPTMRTIELLSPARDSDTGIAAVNFGADAVYVGAPRFGARSAVSNTIEEIEKLVNYAHRYRVKVYAALNTILFDSELESARSIIFDLYNIGIDAVIIQDMGVLEMDIPPVPLHASTQTDNFNLDRIKFLDKTGFPRIVLARELSLEQIKAVRAGTSCELEFFIHGALCVSLSGRCYMSASSGGRSANRGECAQPCRKSYALTDRDGNIISDKKFPLSLKDLNHTENLRDIIDAGITSLKIEGRLKDINYVKNITAHYRKMLDFILEERDDLSKASSGRVYFDFTPDPSRTFNRGYTEYFLHGRECVISSPDTPKSLGMSFGEVTQTGSNWFSISKPGINNGDGLAFFDRNRNLTGIKVNRVDENKIFPLSMNGIFTGAAICRNDDPQFERILSVSKTERRVDVTVELTETIDGYRLKLTDEDNISAISEINAGKETQRSGENGTENIKKQLAKFGGTMFSASEIRISLNGSRFIPVSVLNELRRTAAENMLKERISRYRITPHKIAHNDVQYPLKKIDFTHNVSNHLAESFYRRHGVTEIERSFETSGYSITGPLMTTKLCVKYENGLCTKYGSKAAEFHEPFFLTDGKVRYRVEFNCADCIMMIYRD